MKKLYGIIATMLLVASVGVCQDQTHNPACPLGTIPFTSTRDSAGKLHDAVCLNVLTGGLQLLDNVTGVTATVGHYDMHVRLEKLE